MNEEQAKNKLAEIQGEITKVVETRDPEMRLFCCLVDSQVDEGDGKRMVLAFGERFGEDLIINLVRHLCDSCPKARADVFLNMIDQKFSDN
jgi:coproporphyrinogen III oxidase